MFEKIKSWLTINAVPVGVKGFLAWARTAFNEDQNLFVLKNAYKTHAYVNIAVEKIAQNAVRAKMEIYEKEKLVESGHVFELFRDVNPQMSEAQLIEATLSWILTRGECIWVLAGQRPGTILSVPQEIYVYDPQNFTEFLNTAKTKIIMWEYRVGAERVPFSPDQIIHFQKWNMWNQFRGVNPLIAQETELAEDIYIGKSNTALLKNKSVPSGLLSTEQVITEEQAKDILDMWDKRHGGSSKAGKTGVLGYGTKYQRIAMTPADMEYYKLKQWNRTTILGKHGVPAIVAGFKDDQTPLSGDDTKEQMKFFWDITLLSHLKFLEDKLATEFSARFAPTMKIKFNVSEIPELQEDLFKLYERQRADVAAGILKQNEVRKMRGLDPVPWGDTWWKPVRVADVTSTTAAPANNRHSVTALIEPDSPYSRIYRSAHWYAVVNKWKDNEISLREELRLWMQDQRSLILKEIAETGGGISMFKKFNAKYWQKQKAHLKTLTDATVGKISQAALEDVKILLADLEVDQKYLGFVDEASVVENKIVRMHDALFIFVENAIKVGNIDDVREKYKIAQARLRTISHIEVGRVINEVRIKAYKAVGIPYHEWLSIGEPGSAISAFKTVDGEIQEIGKKFSNGLTYPDNGEFALTLPIIKGGDDAITE